VNEAMIRFTGSTACTVARADVKFDEGDALKHWLRAKPIDEPLQPEPAESPATAPAVSIVDTPKPATEMNPAATGSLRAALVNDLATRLNQKADDLQVRSTRLTTSS
jgi:hypothetical protein